MSSAPLQEVAQEQHVLVERLLVVGGAGRVHKGGTQRGVGVMAVPAQEAGGLVTQCAAYGERPEVQGERLTVAALEPLVQDDGAIRGRRPVLEFCEHCVGPAEAGGRRVDHLDMAVPSQHLEIGHPGLTGAHQQPVLQGEFAEFSGRAAHRRLDDAVHFSGVQMGEQEELLG